MDNWKKYKLGDLCSEISYGYTESASWDKIGPKFLRITDIQNDSINWDLVPYCKVSDKDRIKYALEYGDIVIARTGNSTGATAIIKDEVDAVYASYLIKYKLNHKLAFPFFVGHIMKSKSWNSYVASIRGGSAQPGANAKQFAEFEILLPPLPEQIAISEILSSLDDKIELNLQTNKTLEEMANALYKHWFVDFGPFKNGKFVESELGMIPEGWEVKRLDEFVTVKRGGSPRPIQDYLRPEGLPWVKISDATASNSPFLLSTQEFIRKEGLNKTILLSEGSLILSNSASPGIPKFLNIDACIHDGWLHFPQIKRLNKYILFLLFLRIKQSLISQGNGSVFTNLKTDILKSQLVIVPTLQVEDEFTSIITEWFHLIRQNSIQTQSLKQTRDYLLPKLISGEIRVKQAAKTVKEIL